MRSTRRLFLAALSCLPGAWQVKLGAAKAASHCDWTVDRVYVGLETRRLVGHGLIDGWTCMVEIVHQRTGARRVLGEWSPQSGSDARRRVRSVLDYLFPDMDTTRLVR